MAGRGYGTREATKKRKNGRNGEEEKRRCKKDWNKRKSGSYRPGSNSQKNSTFLSSNMKIMWATQDLRRWVLTSAILRKPLDFLTVTTMIVKVNSQPNQIIIE